jgi:diketogulonate reductase-like aldo/keto reductase
VQANAAAAEWELSADELAELRSIERDREATGR